MPVIPGDLVSDIYQGVKAGFKRNPLLWGSTVLLWIVLWAVYLWVYPALAKASDMKRVDSKVDIVLRITIENQLRDLVKARCDSPPQHYWTLQSKINDQKDEYEALTGRKWKEPTCEEARR